MKTLVVVAVAGLAFALHAPAGLACGYCVEDKIASVYDHAVITRALAQKHHVAFFALDGTLPRGANAKRALEQLVETAAGVDAGGARASIENASLSVAFDPARVPYPVLLRHLQKALARVRLVPQPLRLMDQPADLQTLVRS